MCFSPSCLWQVPTTQNEFCKQLHSAGLQSSRDLVSAHFVFLPLRIQLHHGVFPSLSSWDHKYSNFSHFLSFFHNFLSFIISFLPPFLSSCPSILSFLLPSSNSFLFCFFCHSLPSLLPLFVSILSFFLQWFTFPFIPNNMTNHCQTCFSFLPPVPSPVPPSLPPLHPSCHLLSSPPSPPLFLLQNQTSHWSQSCSVMWKYLEERRGGV